HQRVEVRAAREVRSFAGLALEQPGREGGGQIEDMVPDCDAGARSVGVAEDAKRQILNRKIAAREVRTLDPAPAGRVVRAIQFGHCILPRRYCDLPVEYSREKE